MGVPSLNDLAVEGTKNTNKTKNKRVLLTNCYASRPLLRCRPRARYEVHELPLFVEKSRSCRVVQERALVQHEQVASKKNSLHEHTRALYVIATRRLFYDELNAMSIGWRCDETQLNIFSIDLFSSAASFTAARSRLWCRIVWTYRLNTTSRTVYRLMSRHSILLCNKLYGFDCWVFNYHWHCTNQRAHSGQQCMHHLIIHIINFNINAFARMNEYSLWHM